MMFQQLKIAFLAYKTAIDFIGKHKLWGWLWLPGLINLALMMVLSIAAWQYSAELTDDVVAFFGFDDETIMQILFWIILIMMRLVVLLLFAFTYKYLNLILLSPVLALLADKIYTIQTGREIPFNWSTFVNNVIRGVAIAFKNLIKELFLTVLISLFAFTVILSPLVPILLFLLQSYYYGFSMMDYYNELDGISAKKSSQVVWENKALVAGNGMCFSMMLLIPFFGPLIAPILSLTAMFVSIEKKKITC